MVQLKITTSCRCCCVFVNRIKYLPGEKRYLVNLIIRSNKWKKYEYARYRCIFAVQYYIFWLTPRERQTKLLIFFSCLLFFFLLLLITARTMLKTMCSISLFHLLSSVWFEANKPFSHILMGARKRNRDVSSTWCVRLHCAICVYCGLSYVRCLSTTARRSFVWYNTHTGTSVCTQICSEQYTITHSPNEWKVEEVYFIWLTFI